MDYQQALALAHWVNTHMPPKPAEVVFAGEGEWNVKIWTEMYSASEYWIEDEIVSSKQEARALLGY